MTNKFSVYRRISLAATAITLAGGALLGGAKPAQAGPSGLSYYPSTDIYPKGNIHFDADYFASVNGKSSSFQTTGFEYGLGPERDGLFGRTEIGLDYLTSASGLNHGDRLFFNVKTQLFNDSKSGTRATLGAYGVGSRDVGASNYVSLLGSKAFSFGRITAGVAYALRDDFVDKKTSFQLGYDKALNDKFILAVDYQTGKSQAFSPGIIYLINDKAGVQLSYVRGGSAFTDRNQFYFGFDYNFGKVYAAPTSPEAPAGAAGSGGGGGGG